MTRARGRRIARWTLVAAGVALCGCPPPPRPQELDDLRLMLDSLVVSETAPRAPEAIAAARETQADAESAWEGGDLELSARLSRLAQVQVRLGVALARQALAQDRRAEAERTLAESEAAYREIEARRQVLESRLSRLWAYRRVREDLARERAQAVEEEALRAERLGEAERAAWERNWRVQARADAADAQRTLQVARLLGVERVYPEAARMAREAIDTAGEAVDSSPWRIERPLVDYALAQADELRFRMLSLETDEATEATGQRVRELVETYRTGFDPPFQVSFDPRGVLLTLDAKAAELEIAFPEPAATALRDLRTKWTADSQLLCLAVVQSLDPDCGEECVTRTTELARRAAAEVSGVPDAEVQGAESSGAASGEEAPLPRIGAVGLGFTKEETPPAGLSRAGAVRIEFLLFPRVEIPSSATPGHTESVAAGSQ
jgi:hypothetical protein